MPKALTRRQTTLTSLALAAALLLVLVTLSTAIDWRSADAQDERRAVAITAGAEHACALLDSGEIECWGSGYGQTDAPAGHFHAVSAGGGHTCALRETSEIVCWGNDTIGRWLRSTEIKLGF